MQRLAASLNEPDGSLKTQRLSVAAPLEDPPPQAASHSAVATQLPMTIGLRILSAASFPTCVTFETNR